MSTTSSTGSIAPSFSLIGVNLAGAEFGPQNDPGVYERDYIYPTHQELDYYAAKGLSVIRLPFLMDRLQNGAGGPLDAKQLALMDGVVNYATSKGLRVILDPHDYGYEHGVLIRDPASVAAFANFWGQVARHFQANPLVMFGLENEPHVQTAAEWLPAVNAAIAAIRSVGAVQQILIPAIAWQSAANFTTDGSSTILASGVVDPIGNYAFEVHQYLDSDASGATASIANGNTNIGPERLQQITQWATQTVNRLFLGEIGVGTDAMSLAALDKTLAYMQQHSTVWEGVTYFAGGPWWGNTAIAIEPSGLGTSTVIDRPQMSVLAKYAVAQQPTTPAIPQAAATTSSSVPAPQTTPAVSAALSAQDNLVIQVSEDAWQGDAQFTIGVDGVLVGGVRTTSTLHSSGNSDTVTLAGKFGAGSHKVTVSFINDAYGGTSNTDRNLYVKSVSINGNKSLAPPATMLSNGSTVFEVAGPATIALTTLTVGLSEDAWMGDARFVVAVDGNTLGSAQDVTALHSSHQSQAFKFTQALSSGAHDVAVSFLNDAYGGTYNTDRNLYVDSVAVNGSSTPGAVATMLSQGTTHFSILVPN